MNGKLWILSGLMFMLVLASGIVAAQGSGFETGEEPDRGFISVDTVDQTETTTELEIGVISIGALETASGEPISNEEYRAFAASCSGNENYEICIAEKINAATGGPEISSIAPESVEGAVFKVEYFNSFTNSYVPVCEEAIADNSRPLTDEEGDLSYYTNIEQYYYATCTVPKSIYEGKTANLRVRLIAPASVVAPDVTTQVADEIGPSGAGAFSEALNEIITGMISGDGTSVTYDGGTLPCLFIFILMGLLLASMYFAGKSPITLLDITTPRMPAPKGVAAGGQIMLPYGYGEMKKSLGRKMGAAAGAVGATAAEVAKRRGHDSQRDKMEKDAKGAGASGDELKMKKGIASLARSKGYSSKEMENLMRKSIDKYGDAEHKILSELIQHADKMGGKTSLMGQSIRDYMLSVRTMQTMNALSGHPSATTKSALHNKLVGNMGKYVGGGRYGAGTGISTMTIGSTESMIRSGRVAGRGAKAIIQHAPDLARSVAKTTMSMVGGERAMEKLERSRPKTAAWLKKPSKKVDVGQMFPVGEKMNELYDTLKKEVVNDEMKFAIKQLYKKMGVNFAITEEELVQMGYKDMNILEASGYNKNKARIAEIEPEIIAILSSKEMSSVEKRDKLMALAEKHGAISTEAMSQMKQFNERFDHIEASGEPGYNKFLQLQEMLVQHEKTAAAASAGQVMADDHFYTIIGRSSVAGSDLWETMVLRNFINDAEKGQLNGGGLKEELQIGWLKTLNRMTSLKPTSNMEELPSYMRNRAELDAVEKRVESTIKDLLTSEGKANLTTFSGKSVSSAGINELEMVLYGGKSKAPADKSIIDEEGRVAWWGEAKQLGPLPGNFKGNMSELWITELKTNEALALGMWTESRFKRSYIEPWDATVEANLDRMPGSSKWSIAERTEMAKKEWTKKLLSEDMENRFNSTFGLNTYGKAPETAAFYAGITAGFLEKALHDKGLPSNHPDLVTAQSIDVTNPSQLKKLQGLLTKHRDAFEEVMAKPVTYDDIVNSKQAMVMLYEGGFAFAHKGMPLSSSDRVYGTVTIRDQNGRKKEFEPTDIAIDFPGRDDLRMQFAKARESKDPKEWTALMEGVEKWKNEGGYNYEKEKIFGALVWEYGSNTYDYQKYYSKTSMEITPKREATPVAPEVMRMFGIEGERVREATKPFHNMSEDIGTYIGKVAMVAGGPVFRHSYDITPVTTYARQHSWRLAANVYTKDYADLTAAEKRAYEKVGAAHFEYHHVWQWAIDRNPMRHSTSHGLQGSTESYFHFGPRETYASENYLRGTMTKAQWQSWKYGPWGAFADIATRIHMVPAGMVGGMQMAMQGYPSKWDQTGSSLKPWDYVSDTRTLEATRSLNPFTSAFGKMASKMNLWEGSLERRQLAGEDIKAGLAAGPQDTMFKRTGVYSAARLADTNPGSEYVDYEFKHKLDPAMAEWFVRNKEAVYIHDHDVKKQAYSNTTRRTVAAEALAVRREQELRQFGVFQNSIYGFANPLLFAWHLPIAPPSWSPKEIIQKQARKAKYGGGRKWTANVQDMLHTAKNDVTRAAQPWKGNMVGYCRKCGSPGYKGAPCSKCGKPIYGA